MRLTNIDDSLTVQSDVNLQMMVGNDYIKIKGGIENFVKGNRGNDRFVLHSGKTGQYLGGKGSDTFKIFGGIDNDVYGNKGADRLTLNGGQGRYRGGAGSDRINVLKAEERTVVNGNRGKDYITGSAEGVSYYGGKGQDILAVSQGEVWGGKGKDTFRGVKGDGYAVIRDYIIGEDYVELEHEGSWSNTDSGLIFRDISGDQVMLLLGINDIESVSLL